MAWGKLTVESVQAPKLSVGGLSHRGIFIVGILLSLFGLLMIYSSSAVLGLQKFGDGLYYVKKQAIMLGIGWGLYFLFSQMNVLRFFNFRIFFLILSFFLLAIVMIPGVGSSGGGAQRWINLGFFVFQPAELVRLLMVFYMASTLIVKEDRLHSFNRGFLPLFLTTMMMMVLLIAQPDFGSAMSLFAISFVLWFVGGVPSAFLGGLFILAIPAVVFVIFNAAYRAKRVFTFLDPWQDPQGSGFQVIQSFVAFYQGGWTGLGLGQGQQKLFYLPKAHTDFIFSVIGEELGVVGVLVVIGLFVSLLLMGWKIASRQVSKFGFLVASGVLFFLMIPVVLNMLVTVGLLPTKGLPLPFFSSGGSSLIVSLGALGVLQSLYRHQDEEVS